MIVTNFNVATIAILDRESDHETQREFLFFYQPLVVAISSPFNSTAPPPRPRHVLPIYRWQQQPAGHSRSCQDPSARVFGVFTGGMGPRGRLTSQSVNT